MQMCEIFCEKIFVVSLTTSKKHDTIKIQIEYLFSSLYEKPLHKNATEIAISVLLCSGFFITSERRKMSVLGCPLVLPSTEL